MQSQNNQVPLIWQTHYQKQDDISSNIGDCACACSFKFFSTAPKADNESIPFSEHDILCLSENVLTETLFDGNVLISNTITGDLLVLNPLAAQIYQTLLDRKTLAKLSFSLPNIPYKFIKETVEKLIQTNIFHLS